MNEGIIRGLPAAEYHADEALSSSRIRDLLTSPLHYLWRRANPEPPTPAMRFGTAAHMAVLEPARYEQLARPISVSSRATKAWKEAEAAAGPEDLLLTADEFNRIRRMADVLKAHKSASELLSGTREAPEESEVSVFWTEMATGLQCKARIDRVWNGSILIDYKTTDDAGLPGFHRKVLSMGYHIQGAWYRMGYGTAAGCQPTVILVAQEKEEPHAVAVYQLDESMIGSGWARCHEAMGLLCDCLRTGIYPGYPETVQVLSLK